MHYMRSSDGTVTSTQDLMEWATWYENAERQVARDEVGEATISTVFLSVNHDFTGLGPPILWETMIFGGPHDEYQERYISEEAAKTRHAEIFRRLKEGLPLDEPE